MSLLKNKSSFIIFHFETSLDMAYIRDALISLPFPEITGKQDLEGYSFSRIDDIYSKNIEIVNMILPFSYRKDFKKIPKAKLKKLHQEKIKEHYPKHQINRIPDEEFEELLQNCIDELSVKTSPREMEVQIILDFQSQLLYIEKKSPSEVFSILNRLFLVLDKKMDFKTFHPFSEKIKNTYGESNVIDMFLFWLFIKTKEKDDEKKKVGVDSKIRISDKKTDVVVKGDILPFVELFKQMSRESKIKECSVVFEEKISEDNSYKIYYTLTNKSLGISNFCDTRSYIYAKNEISTNCLLKAADFKNMAKHIASLIKIFEKFMFESTSKELDFILSKWEEIKP